MKGYNLLRLMSKKNNFKVLELLLSIFKTDF
jgi:hypothetical protein